MFETKGDRAQWRVIYDKLASMGIGDVVKDEELYVLLPDAPEASVRNAFWTAVRHIQEDRRRTFDRERLVGYRMVHPRESERLVKSRHRRARRQMRKGVDIATSTDRSKLTREERQRIDAIELHIAQQRDMLRRLDARVKSETRERKAGHAELSERVDKLTALLAKHGIGEQATV